MVTKATVQVGAVEWILPKFITYADNHSHFPACNVETEAHDAYPCETYHTVKVTFKMIDLGQVKLEAMPFWLRVIFD